MGIRKSSHAVYDLKYHLVWIPKYRARILRGGKRLPEGSFPQDSGGIRILDRHDGSDGRPRAFVYWSPTEVFAVAAGADTEEHIGSRTVQEVSTNEEGDVVGEDME